MRMVEPDHAAPAARASQSPACCGHGKPMYPPNMMAMAAAARPIDKAHSGNAQVEDEAFQKSGPYRHEIEEHHRAQDVGLKQRRRINGHGNRQRGPKRKQDFAVLPNCLAAHQQCGQGESEWCELKGGKCVKGWKPSPLKGTQRHPVKPPGDSGECYCQFGQLPFSIQIQVAPPVLPATLRTAVHH